MLRAVLIHGDDLYRLQLVLGVLLAGRPGGKPAQVIGWEAGDKGSTLHQEA
jgi:hypothetical protein